MSYSRTICMAQKVYTLSDIHSLPLTYNRIKTLNMLNATDFVSPIQSDNYSMGKGTIFVHKSSIQKLFNSEMNEYESSSNNQVYRCDTAFVYSTNDTVRFIPSYNANGKVTGGLTEKWSNGQWIDSTKDTITFNSKGRILTDLSQVWSNGQWITSSLYTNTYDSSGHLLVYMYQQYSNGDLVDYYIGTTSYDAQGRRINFLWESWSNGKLNISYTDSYTYKNNSNWHTDTDLQQDWSNGQYINSSLSTSIFDSSGHEVCWLVQLWSNGQWVNDERDTTSFDSSGNEISSISQQWLNGQWTNNNFTLNNHVTVAFDSSGHGESAITQQWLNGQWVNVQQESRTFDANGNMLTDLFQQWSNGQWKNIFLNTYTYDENGNNLSQYNSIWSDSSWIPSDNQLQINYGIKDFTFFGYSMKISYSLLNTTNISTKVVSIPNKYSLSQNYPNPFNPSTTISFSLPSKSFVTLKVYDILGREIVTIVSEEMPAGRYSKQWNAANLSSGIYFYRLQAGSYTETKKMILLK